MPYLIDGHNLIGKMPYISLSDLDDEQDLFNLLDSYFKSIRKKAVVFFDQASLANTNKFHSAFVEARFILNPSSADEAILLRIRKLGGNAKNYTIITSDHWIADNAHAAGATVVSSEDFSNILLSANKTSTNERNQTKDDIDYWLNQFHKDFK